MAQKTQEKGVTGPAPVVDEPGRVRNVVLVGHSGAGKTTLVEAMLAVTGTIGRAGSVTEGTTVSDYDPAAVRQQRSVSLSCAPVIHEGIKVNLLVDDRRAGQAHRALLAYRRRVVVADRGALGDRARAADRAGDGEHRLN